MIILPDRKYTKSLVTTLRTYFIILFHLKFKLIY